MEGIPGKGKQCMVLHLMLDGIKKHDIFRSLKVVM